MTLKNLKKEFLLQFPGRKLDLAVAEKVAGVSFQKLVRDARAMYHESVEEQLGEMVVTWERNAGVHKKVHFIDRALPRYYHNMDTTTALAYRLSLKGFLSTLETTGSETHGFAFKATVRQRGLPGDGRLAWEVSNMASVALMKALLRAVENYKSLRSRRGR